jgi:hypothetical protein
MKIYVAAAAEPLRKKKKEGVKLRNHQNWWFSEFQLPPLNANVLFCRFFLNLTSPVYDQTQGVCVEVWELSSSCAQCVLPGIFLGGGLMVLV